MFDYELRVWIKAFVVVCGLLLVAILILAGCTVTKQADGTLGIEVGISEETHESVQDTLDTATDTAGGLSAIFPVLTPIATALGVGGLTWRKMKKTLVKKQKPLEMLVGVLEQLKQTDQTTWDKVKAQIKAEYPDVELRTTIEETLAELRRQGKLAKSNI